MLKCTFRTLVLAFFVALSPVAIFGQHGQALVGVKIVAKTSDATVKVGNQVIAKSVDLIYGCDVRKVNGEWLWIWTKKGEGWIKRSDVVTTVEAIPYFTAVIIQNPTDDYAYNSRGIAYRDLAAR